MTAGRPRAWITRGKALIAGHFPDLYAVAAIIGLFVLSDPGDRVGFATGAVVTALAALVATRADREDAA
jgi:hypothetical protein